MYENVCIGLVTGTRRVGGFPGLKLSVAVMGVRVPLRTLVGLYPSETDVHGLCGLGNFSVTVTTPLPTPCQQAPAFATVQVGGRRGACHALSRLRLLFLLKCLRNCRGITALASCHLQWPQSSWAAGLGG